MRRRSHGSITLVLLAFVAAAPLAQSRPDFSGTWVVVSPADAAGQAETLQQDAETLSVRHPSESGHHRRTYRLDGTETKSVWQSHGRDVVTTSRASWDGATLVIHEVTRYSEERTLDARHTLSLTADGRLQRTFTGRLNGEPVPDVTTVSRRR